MRTIERKIASEFGRASCSLAFGLSLLVLNGSSILAFQHQPSSVARNTAERRQQPTSLQAMIDPSDVPSILTGITHHVQTAAPLMDGTSSSGGADSMLSQSDALSAWLSTMYASIPEVQTKFVGTLDKPHFPRELSTIDFTHSIKPNLEELAYRHQIDPKASAETAKDMLPQASQLMQAKTQAAMDKGQLVLDASKIRGGSTSHDVFVGGKQTSSLLAPHVDSVLSPDSPAKFMGRLKWTTTYLQVIDKLPRLAFYYAFVEFFFLRKNFDIYKEEVEDDPTGVAAETISDIAVRAGILFVLAMVTLIFA